MLLNQLLNTIPVIQVVGPTDNIEIKNITLDSREANSESIFIAIRGFKLDGHKFIPQAVANGVSAIVLENDDAGIDQLLHSSNIVKVVVKNSRETLAKLSDRFYDQPSSKLNLIGITGTKGKTTTSYYIKNILEGNNRKSGLIGTNKNMIGTEEIPTKLTTPESHVINSLMNKMVHENCSDCVMEVSSHSLELSRVNELDFNVGVFTNITSDHLDFHSNFQNYLAAKKILFDNLKQSASVLYNKDDEHAIELLSGTNAKQYSYSLNIDSDFKINNVEYNLDGTSFSLSYLDKTFDVHTSLVGLFNAYNATSAIGATVLSDIPISNAIEGVRNTKQVPGRFELISSENKKVIVDYSHTADSLKQALAAIRHIVGESRPVYTVFGCGGDRDKSKRSVMGSIAEKFSDFVFVTSDNPRTENPLEIINDIKVGLSCSNNKVIQDREGAIKAAIEDSEENAVILIAGKGHETYQEIDGVRHFFSDKEVAQKYL